MSGDLSTELRRDRRLARRTFAASSMSNSKWRVVFAALAGMTPVPRQIRVKFIDSDEDRPVGLPWLDAPHAFVDSFEVGPFPLVAIEWIEVPAIALFPRPDAVPAEHHPQDIDAALAALEATGRQLPITRTATGLRIVGHQR